MPTHIPYYGMSLPIEQFLASPREYPLENYPTTFKDLYNNDAVPGLRPFHTFTSAILYNWPTLHHQNVLQFSNTLFPKVAGVGIRRSSGRATRLPNIPVHHPGYGELQSMALVLDGTTVLDLGGKLVPGTTFIVHTPHDAGSLEASPFKSTNLGSHFILDPNMDPAATIDRLHHFLHRSGYRSGELPDVNAFLESVMNYLAETEAGRAQGASNASGVATASGTAASAAPIDDPWAAPAPVPVVPIPYSTFAPTAPTIEAYGATLQRRTRSVVNEDDEEYNPTPPTSVEPSESGYGDDGDGSDSEGDTDWYYNKESSIPPGIDKPLENKAWPKDKSEAQLMLDYPPPPRLRSHYELRPTVERLGIDI
ncbi:hypothetical protein EIP91_011188 [Steccherinum ochraceum]|uniref:Uncharacterized protein n=1 Tax=Steccherinum ochraceum TaxID=92696 RepID=A0A4R0QZY7_9APHY|nr:hypothetical protein EIP91_011188 [Steccherinum ochraceum]